MAKRRLRFSLRAMLLLVMAIAVLLAFAAAPFRGYRRERPVVDRIRELGGTVNHRRPPSIGHWWISGLGGGWLYARVADVHLANRDVTEEDLRLLGRLKHLQNLVLISTPVTGEGLAGKADWPKLEKIQLQQSQATDAFLAALSSCTRLKALYLNNTKITDAGLAHLGDLTELETLDLRDTAVTDDGLVYLRGLSQLETLRLVRTSITYKAMEELEAAWQRPGEVVIPHARENLLLAGDFVGTRSLELDDGANAGVALEHARRLHDVEMLSLSGAQANDAVLAGFGHLAGLTALNVYYPNTITDSGLAAISQFQNLERLQIESTLLTATGMESLAKLRQLKWLTISAPPLTGGLEHLGGLQKLERLLIESHSLEHGELKHLKKLRSLRQLTFVDSTSLSADDLRQIGQLKSLQSLDLTGSRIDSAGVQYLAGLRDLGVLMLTETNVGDEGLETLAELPELQVISLYDTSVTEAGVRSLRALKSLRSIYVKMSVLSPEVAQEVRSQRGDLLLMFSPPQRGMWSHRSLAHQSGQHILHSAWLPSDF